RTRLLAEQIESETAWTWLGDRAWGRLPVTHAPRIGKSHASPILRPLPALSALHLDQEYARGHEGDCEHPRPRDGFPQEEESDHQHECGGGATDDDRRGDP